MPCQCDKQQQQRRGSSNQTGELGVEWQECEYEPSSLFDGRFWPRTRVEPLVLAASGTRRVEVVSAVRVTMLVTVISGVLSLWFAEHASDPRPAGDQAHAEFVSGQGPTQVVLPPGQHRFVFGAANSAACTATVVFLDRDAHEESHR